MVRIKKEDEALPEEAVVLTEWDDDEPPEQQLAATLRDTILPCECCRVARARCKCVEHHAWV